MNEQAQFDFLDALTLISFIMQVRNQQNILSIADVQKDNDRAVAEIHKHLEAQDKKLDTILKVVQNADNRET